MKFIFTISLASLLFFFGCDQASEITSPLNESPDQQLKVTSVQNLSDSTSVRNPYLHRKDIFTDDGEYPPGADSIFVPMKLPGSANPNLIVSEVIDGNVGGKIDFHYEYITEMFDTLTIRAQLNIPDSAFYGVEEITMIFNNEIGAISFYPHMVFSDTVKFKITYTGFDLSGIDPNSVDFIFQKYGGTTEQIEYAEMNINVSTGRLEVKGSELHHFSRYGFVN